MEIVCGFHNIQEMARAVHESAECIEGKKFSPRPWNRFEPENTSWWIVPSTDWPAYRYGKGMFRFTGCFPGYVLCCLNVEKGFGRIVGEAYPELVARGHIADEHWTWFAFLSGLEDGSVARAAQAVMQETGSQVIMEISAGYPTSPEDFDPYSLLVYEGPPDEECRSSVDAGLVWFTVTGENLNRLGKRCVGEIMAPVADCQRLADLPKTFRGIQQLPWVWIDIYIGTLVSLIPNEKEPTVCWDASDIWRRLLRPWLPWII